MPLLQRFPKASLSEGGGPVGAGRSPSPHILTNAILICRAFAQATGNRNSQPTKSLPQRPKGAVQGKVGRRRQVGRGQSPCDSADLHIFCQENDLFRLRQNNASIFCRIHLPLNRQLRCLGKAFGCRNTSPNQNLPRSRRNHSEQGGMIYGNLRIFLRV